MICDCEDGLEVRVQRKGVEVLYQVMGVGGLGFNDERWKVREREVKVVKVRVDYHDKLTCDVARTWNKDGGPLVHLRATTGVVKKAFGKPSIRRDERIVVPCQCRYETY